MTVGTYTAPDNTSQSGTTYKTNIDNSIIALAPMGSMFAPHEHATPQMKVTVDAGIIHDSVGNSISSIAQQSTGTITAPSTNPRIDRVVLDPSDGTISVITGSEAASPTAPSITSNAIPICQVLLTTSHTEIVNTDITDERAAMFIYNINLGKLQTNNDVTLKSTTQPNFFVLDYSADSILMTAGTNSTTDYPFNIQNAAENYAASYGAYGINNTALGATTIDYNIVVGSDLNITVTDTFNINDSGSAWKAEFDTDGQLVVQSAGADILQLVDPNASSNNDAQSYLEFSWATAIDNTQNRMGFFGFADNSNADWDFRNEVSGGDIDINTNSGFVNINSDSDFNGEITSQNGQVAFAHGLFDGTAGTPTFTDDYNFGSITDNGPGDYTLNFTTSASAATYTALSNCEDGAGNTRNSKIDSRSTGSVTVVSKNNAGTDTDSIMHVVVFSKE